MSSVRSDSIVEFFEPMPTSIIGESALIVSFTGWLRSTDDSFPDLTFTIDKGAVQSITLGEPIPGTLRLENTSEIVKWIGFSGLIHLPKAAIGFIHNVCISIAGADYSDEYYYNIERQQPDGPVLPNTDSVIAICMAVYNPPKDVFARQISSIIDQDRSDWICIINDDGSNPESVELILQTVENDSRFYYFRNSSNLGFYSNFETALARVPDHISYIALADQDDYWYPHKLSTLSKKMREGCQLVYSDLKIVDESGIPQSESYWGYRLNEYKNLKLMLVANTVTGAAAMFRRDLLETILPFPAKIGDSFHDHWLACAALARGKIGYIDSPLYDYYQYGRSIIGHCDFSVDSSKPFPWRWYQLINPINMRNLMRRFIGSSLAIYWFECRRISLICANLKARRIKDANNSLTLFKGGQSSIWKLLILHFSVSKIKRITNHAELRLARAYLVYISSRFLYRIGIKQKPRINQ